MWRSFIFIFFLSPTFVLQANLNERIDIVSYSPYLLPSPSRPYKYTKLINNYDVHFHYNLYDYVKNFRDSPNLKKIIFFDYCEDPKTHLIPKSKLVCFKWEAMKIRPDFYDFYHRVYTFDDDLVDNVKFFKFHYPVLQPILKDIPSFEDKQLCAMVVGNWIPERVKILDFFSKKPKDSLHVYGVLPLPYRHSGLNKGVIPGFYSGPEKLETLKKYKFSICFENTHTVPGYITEKIFDVFSSGCIPIYWGPNNIDQYIPSGCFIDYKRFKNDEEMYQYITSMTKEKYNQYIENIRKFLLSRQAQLFSQNNFEELLYHAVNT